MAETEDRSRRIRTSVVFRKWRNGSILAMFPELEAEPGRPDLCMSYEHFGQHGPASLGLVGITGPAFPDEYAALLAELESLGYDLTVRTRLTRRTEGRDVEQED